MPSKKSKVSPSVSPVIRGFSIKSSSSCPMASLPLCPEFCQPAQGPLIWERPLLCLSACPSVNEGKFFLSGKGPVKEGTGQAPLPLPWTGHSCHGKNAAMENTHTHRCIHTYEHTHTNEIKAKSKVKPYLVWNALYWERDSVPTMTIVFYGLNCVP